MKNDSIIKLGLVLMVICLVSGTALAVTYRITKGKIAEQIQEKQLEALKVVLPRAAEFSSRESGVDIDYYKGLDKDKKVVGYAFPGEAKGYGSTIQVMVGVNPEGDITGIKITEQKETPGLGTRAVEIPVTRTFWQAILGKGGSEKPGRPWFEEQFAGKIIKNLKVVTGKTNTEIQALTGATITSKAVTKAVRESMEKFVKQGGGGRGRE
ncbi:MAG: RnfABCDGE type electron transport complex subunit G [Candidatus Auribacterota bacterium]|nr:RnfABCDGE type electron transport complex subunit G [Candidatus Auribacterota bacterium]